MAIKILMPALSPTMTEGNLAKWLKKEGDKVKPGEVIAEIETDKAVMEVEATDGGVLGKIIVPEKTEGVKVNQLIAMLLEPGEKASDLANVSEEAPKETAKTENKAPASKAAQPQNTNAKSDNNRLFVSPLARKIANQNNVDLSHVQGSGPNGRIVRADVEAAMHTGAQTTPTHTYTTHSTRTIPNSQMRKVIAKRLTESKQKIPHVYLTMECEVTELLEARSLINSKAKVRDGKPEYKLSVNDFVIKAVAKALRKYPAVNSSWSDDAITQYGNIDISIAVAIPDGLITPIVFTADQKGLVEISQNVKQLAEKAKNNSLKPEEFQGGTFTISNLGMYGVTEFQAIINPPQSAILAVSGAIEKPVIKNGQIVKGSVMMLSISVDHRVIDGVLAAEFMSEVVTLLANPIMLLA